VALCPSCGQENPPGFRFCGACGRSLSRVCGSCGAEVPEGFRFCGACGTPFEETAGQGTTVATEAGAAGPPSTPASERRLVSVLFADLVGFTTLSEHRDAEDVRELLSRYFDTARELIGRYGGTVEKFIGDAVMAVWGTPAAHEDDAERAVRAGLDLVEAVARLGLEVGAPDLQARAGVLTGEAAVTIGAEAQGMVAGDLVNTASRLQSAAAAGTVLVGEGTYLATSKAIAYEDAGQHDLKGKELPVRLWRAIRVVAGRQGFRLSEALEAPFVGRDEEIRLIKELFHATAREGRPRLVSIMGVGGIGKSRLAWEFFKYVDGLAETVYWHQGRSPAYGEGITFWALAEMVRMRARIAETEDAVGARAKLASTLEEWVTDAEERRWVEPRIAHLLGLEERPTGEREELFAAWRTFFERIADRGPIAMVFEDLQWADTGTVDFIESVLEWSKNAPIFLITLSRPELTDRRPSWGAGQRNFVSVHLEPLPDPAMTALLAGLAPGLPDRLVSQILERAEGVPLYAVETVRMLVDRGRLASREGVFELSGEPGELEVPSTLHALIAARLDALDAEDRALVQHAAVAGKTFTLSALAAISGRPAHAIEPRLRELMRKEIVVLDADPRSPERGQYGFVQSLIREVAYQTLAKRDRRAKHLAAARYFEDLGDEELAGAVATHYIEAYRATPEGPEGEAIAVRARDALVAAADRARSLGSYDQAVAYLEQALTVTTDEAGRAALYERAGDSAKEGGRFEAGERYLSSAIDWYRKNGEPRSEARAASRLGSILMVTGRLDAAIAQLTSALEVVRDLPPDAATAELASQLARAYMFKVDPEQCRAWADRALDMAERLDVVPVIADALITKGASARDAGRWREGVALLYGSLSLAREQGLVFQQSRALVNLSDILTMTNPRAALAAVQEARGLMQKVGQRESEGMILLNLAWAAIPVGEWDLCLSTVEEVESADLPIVYRAAVLVAGAVVDAFRGGGHAFVERLRSLPPLAEVDDPQFHVMTQLAMAQISLAGSNLTEAAEQATASFELDPTGPYSIAAGIIAARSCLWLGDVDRAAELLRRLDDTTAHGGWVDTSRQTLRAGVSALEGRQEEAGELYREAIASWRELDVPLDLAMCELDLVLLMNSEDFAVDAVAEEARAILGRLGAAPLLERLERALARGLARR
jgi:class 3 adenylate cyclase/tetratricopeptide (TPR) repeat protein